MLPLQQWVRWLTWLYVASGVLLLAKLWRDKLHRRYRYFFSFLALDVLRTAAVLAVGYHTSLYAWVYFVPEPVMAVLYFLVVLEMYGLVLQDYPGISTLSKWMLRAIFPLAVLISWLILSPGAHAPGQPYPILQSFLVVQRTVIFTVLILLVLIELFLLWYPLNLSRNTVRYCVGYLILFASQTVGLAIVSLVGFRVTPLANLLIQAVSCGCLVFWLFALGTAGESRGARVGAPWSPGEKEQMRRRLEAVNSAMFRLVRAARR